VLVVDDDAAMRKMLRRLLSSAASVEDIQEAGSGGEAIEMLPSFSPDVVIMDAHMPGMNGAEATRQIKERFAHIIVIGVSGTDDHSMREAGATTVLLKGDVTTALVELLESMAGSTE